MPSVYTIDGEPIEDVMKRDYAEMERDMMDLQQVTQENNWLNELISRLEEEIKGLEYQLGARSHIYEPGQERNEE